MELVIGVIIFIAIVLVIVGISRLLKNRWDPELIMIRKKLLVLSTGKVTDNYPTTGIAKKKRPLSNVAWLNRVLCSIPSMYRIDHLLQKANLQCSVGIFVLITIILAFTGFIIATMAMKNYPISLLIAAAAGMAPFFYIFAKKNQRIKKITQQLPDCFDLIARSLKAGHAFTGGLEIISQEFNDPIGGEFAKVIEEINFGVSVEEALKNFAERVDCLDVKFFTIAVIIQRETGGNLADILESISRIIRERFKLQGHIRTLSAEGKLSVVILAAIPFFVFFALSILNPGYINVLYTTPLGKKMAVTAVIMLILGITVMKKIIAIKV